jgi:hypothetical protein
MGNSISPCGKNSTVRGRVDGNSGAANVKSRDKEALFCVSFPNMK